MCFTPRHFSWILFMFLLTLQRVAPGGEAGVWPMPRKMSEGSERYALHPQGFSFRYGRDSSAQLGCSVLDAAFRRYFALCFPENTVETGKQYSMWFRFPFTMVVHVQEKGCDGYPSAASNENYRLSVSAGHGELTANTVWGALRGLESFSQLIYQDDSNTYYINKTEIEDFPRFQYRGILLDTSRHFLPVRTILKTLDVMAYNKFNVLHWHVVDDPSFPYQSQSFPDLSNKGAFHPQSHVYTQADIRKMVSHARLRGIRIIPEFDSPGHTQSWGKGQPGLLTPCYKGLHPSGTFGPVNPTLSTNYNFMGRLLKEVSTLFPDPYIHLGGDEVDFSCWKSNPDVRMFMKKMGFGTDYGKLGSLYFKNMMNIIETLNKTSVVWQDVFDYHSSPKSLDVVEVWKAGCYMCEVRRVTAAGVRVILASPWYLDQPGPTHEWSRFYTVRPLAFTGTEHQKRLLIGGEVCLWGEYVDGTNLAPLLWPRASAAAERLWSDEAQTSSVSQAYPRLAAFRCKLLRRGVQAQPLFVGHCKHEYEDL
ncbi:beta-hexosaminidase subunit alpha [Scleropages formosus]|uniref:beta-hexosaminidase subunit alpha n=1 Tax=Scleropages formosus TaxID=113540 RepID=UPI000878F404|nr:beta-hexosaminidase subunit alpha-like [Scleropages formosus]